MTFGSLFTGIGGIDLGLERAGMECRWQVEVDPFCNKVLEKHWPNVKRYGDIKTLEPSQLERVDIIAGGFPCQDISLQGAVWGKRKGLLGERSGLWGEMFTIIRLGRPSIVLLENVPAITGNGLSRILFELSEIGYDSEWDCLPASAFGAPHQRYRLFLVAYPREERIKGIFSEAVPRFPALPGFKNVGRVEDLRQRSDLPPSLFRGSCDGIPDWVDRVGSCGNAVVPQIAEWIGLRIINTHL